MFRKSSKPEEIDQGDLSAQKHVSGSSDSLAEASSRKDAVSDSEISASNDNLSVVKQDKEAQRELSASSEDLVENNKDMDAESQLSASSENLSDTTGSKEKNLFSGMFKKSSKTPGESSTASGEDATLFGSSEDLLEATKTKEKSGGLSGIFKKSPKPSHRSVVTQDPLTDSKQLSISLDDLTEAEKDERSSQYELSASTDNLCETSCTAKEKKGGFSGMFRRTPKNQEQQEGEDVAPPTRRGLSRKRTTKKKRRNSSKMPLTEQSVEMKELNAPQESTEVMEPVEMAAYPTEESAAQAEQENNELMEWWNSAKGWTEWNENANFQEEDEQMAMEQAANRVYMAARVFVHLFNHRGASLQQRILEMLSVADATDDFHKKTVTAAVGGGVASVAGSVATITGLVLAPFTFGASIIVTAVGISVATAGSITSATANITDTVHSNMDCKKVEKMIQGYQEEIQDIRKCMEFVQEGMNTLEEWDFEKYSESAAKKALNHNIKHVMKEGGRAGKALMINTDKLISTVQVLGAAGGAAKAVRAISVTTGVMSALFLALDVFFLAKNSHELSKGAKTKFAGKIRQVCKDLQDGLLELNKVKTQLQKTMDGIEVEEEFESDPKKLAELEQEIDFLEEKLDKMEDKKEEVEPKKSKETPLDIFNIKNEKKEEKSVKGKEEVEKNEKMSESKSEKKASIETSVKTVKEVSKEQSENQTTAGKEKRSEKKNKMSKEEPSKTPENKREAENEQKESKVRSSDPEKPKSFPAGGEMENPEPGGRSFRSEKDSEKHETAERKEGRGSRHKDGEGRRRRGERIAPGGTIHSEATETSSGAAVESARKRFERAAKEQKEEDRWSQRRRGSDGERGHSRKGCRSQSDALKHEGLNI